MPTHSRWEKRNQYGHRLDREANLKWRALGRTGAQSGGRVPRLPGVRQEGRERGEGQPCRRGRAGTLILTLDPPSPPPRGPAPRPDPPGTTRPPPLAPTCLRPTAPPTPPVPAARKQRFRARPLPNPQGRAGGTGTTPRLSRTPAQPGPHVPGRRRSAELSRAAGRRRSRNTRSRTRSPSLFHAQAGVPHDPPTLSGPRGPSRSSLHRSPPTPTPRQVWSGTYRAASRPGPKAARGFTGPWGRGRLRGRAAEGPGAPGRARSLRLWGRPGPRRSLRRSALPPAPPAR